jgi:hypothetical protein
MPEEAGKDGEKSAAYSADCLLLNMDKPTQAFTGFCGNPFWID